MLGFVVEEPFRKPVGVAKGVFAEIVVDDIFPRFAPCGEFMGERHGFCGDDVDV